MFESRFLLHFRMEHAIMFDFSGMTFYTEFLMPLWLIPPHTQKGGVTIEGSTLLVTEFSEHDSNLFAKRRT